jgi:hypothetical protein
MKLHDKLSKTKTVSQRRTTKQKGRLLGEIKLSDIITKEKQRAHVQGEKSNRDKRGQKKDCDVIARKGYKQNSFSQHTTTQ